MNLPPIAESAYDVNWDQKPKAARYNKSMRAPMTVEMFQCIQDLLADKRLPYGGDVGAFMRDAIASKVASLDDFLDTNARTLWAALRDTQMSLSAERYVLTIENQVKESVELLGRWSLAREWDAVLNSLTHSVDRIQEFPSGIWRRHAADAWLGDPNMQALMHLWEEDMVVESPDTWLAVVALWGRLQQMAR